LHLFYTHRRASSIRKKVKVDLYSAIKRNVGSSNALMSLMSDGKEMRFQVPPKTFGLDCRITQRIRQWVPNRRTGDWESQGAKSAATKPRNIQFATVGRTEMLAVLNLLWQYARSSRRGTSITVTDDGTNYVSLLY